MDSCRPAEFTAAFNAQKICLLETEITSRQSKTGEWIYSIVKENLWEKNLTTIPTRKALLDFTGIDPIASRNENEVFLSDDVSFIIAHNRQTDDKLEICSLLSFTNVNVLPFTEDISLEIIAFLDPTIEKLYFSKEEKKSFIHLKFFGKDEIILNSTAELEQYLSSGTIKGIVTFSMAKEVLKTGGYLIIDEIENHFNKESEYVACTCEGAAESAIIDILIDSDNLIFSRSNMLDEQVIRCRSAEKFEERYLRKGFDQQISVIRILEKQTFRMENTHFWICLNEYAINRCLHRQSIHLSRDTSSR
jgi:hypothetical protein